MKLSALKTLAAALVVAFVAAGCGKTDPGITTAVKSKLAADDTVKAYQINVDTKDHIVTLTGTVDTTAAKAQALALARATDGVTSVVDNLTVPMAAAPEPSMLANATQAASDAATTTAVKTKLLADTKTSGLAINVDTKDNVVTLSGKVKSKVEKDRALQLARNTDGVKSVNDEMTIGGTR